MLVLELALRPFVELEPELTGVRRTSIFVPDGELGWRLRPNADDIWAGARARINSKGLRGPEIPYDRTPGSARVLYLGDSLPFGYQLGRYEWSFPYVTGALLEHFAGLRVETVNAGVGGYSPWQYAGYLKREGIRYAPDLVVVSFVLNDVTEKFELIRFGGSSSGFQLARSTQSAISRILARTALGTLGRRWVARIRFGADVEAGAKRLDALCASTIATEPDREDVRVAWRITLENLAGLFDFCAAHEIPTLLVMFPYRFQLTDPEAFSAPQRELEGFARARAIAFLDLLPVYADAARQQEAGADALFLDKNHPTRLGHRVAAAAIAQRIRDEVWLAPGGRPGS